MKPVGVAAAVVDNGIESEEGIADVDVEVESTLTICVTFFSKRDSTFLFKEISGMVCWLRDCGFRAWLFLKILPWPVVSSKLTIRLPSTFGDNILLIPVFIVADRNLVDVSTPFRCSDI